MAPKVQTGGIQHDLYFVGDDLREAALSVAAIEDYLVKVEHFIGASGDSPGALDELLSEKLVERIERLDDCLTSLHRSLHKLTDTAA